MKALRDLRRFILVKCAEGNEHEVRSYVREKIDKLAVTFRVPANVILGAMDGMKDDRALATRLLETIIRAETLLRRNRAEERARRAQESATILASTAIWVGERAHLDMASLFSSALTKRNDLLVFSCDRFTVGICQAHLLDLSRIARVRAELTGYVDSQGLHLKWRTGRLNLHPRVDPKAFKIIVSLPPVSAIAAA
jgi:hypothetical protein